MSQEHNMRRVTAIQNGTVIDHIPSGHAMRVLDMLGINKASSVPVSMVMNVPSKKMGTKDIIKVEDRELTQSELNRLALVAPDAHVAIIRAYSVAEKMTIELGDEVTNVVRCTFSNCITNPTSCIYELYRKTIINISTWTKRRRYKNPSNCYCSAAT